MVASSRRHNKLIELKRVEEERFRVMLESAPDAVIVSDTRGRIVLANARAEELLGYKRDELIGQAVEMLIPERFRDGHAAHRGNYIADPRTRMMGEDLELCALCKDGSEVPVDISLSPIETDDGTLVFSNIRDDTRRRRIEHDLRDSDARFRAVLESAPDAVIVSDTRGCIVLANARAEELLGYERDELIGQGVDMLIPERSRDRHAAHRGNYIADPRTRMMGEDLELCAVRKDGSEVAVDISLSPIETDDGMLVFSNIRDDTRRRRIEHELRTSEARFRAVAETATTP